jgi:hypothetical protein
MTFEPSSFVTIIGSGNVEVQDGFWSYRHPPLVRVVAVLALIAI